MKRLHLLALVCVSLLTEFVLSLFGLNLLKVDRWPLAYGVFNEGWSMGVFYRNDLALTDTEKGLLMRGRHSRFRDYRAAGFSLVWGDDYWSPAPVPARKTPQFSGYDFFRCVAVGVPNVAAFPILVMIPVLVWTRRFRRRGVKKMGHCAGCGYDLRATPDRCPECGRAVAATLATAAE